MMMQRKKYIEAINSDSELVDAYYNLAVLYNTEGKRDKTKKLLDACLNIDRSYHAARYATQKIQYSEQSDWYEWWFRSSKGKRAFAAGIISSIIVLIAITAYISLGIGNIDTVNTHNTTKGNQSHPINGNITVPSINGNVAGPAALAAILIGVLLLPSLKAFKVAGVELESEFPVHKNVQLEPQIAHLQTKKYMQTENVGSPSKAY